MRRGNIKNISYIAGAACALLFLSGSATAHAANLYLDPAAGEYGKGDTFSAKVRIDNEGECINALDVRLSFPKDKIRAVDVGRGESIITLWVEEPTIDRDAGTVRFSGGIPGGYCGRIPGDPGLTNVLAEVVFQIPGFTVGKGAKAGDRATVSFLPETQVLLSDGLGTPAALVTNGAEFTIGETSTSTKDSWRAVLEDDDIPPEDFIIELVSNEAVFGGQYFIVFVTTDKQSGLDHYEVQESDLDRDGYIRGKNKIAPWKRADSPYLLEDQTLNSTIRVKAVDKAGLERIVQFVPDEALRTHPVPVFELGIGIGIFVLLIAMIGLIRKFIKNKKDPISPMNDLSQ